MGRTNPIPFSLHSGEAMITISGKTLGKKKPLFTDWSIPFPPDLGDGGSLTLRELIGRIVREEVNAFHERQREQKLLHVLTDSAIEKGVVKGKITSGGQDSRQTVDVDGAIATALEAFEDGLYLVILDGQEQRQLDAQVFLNPDSQVAFVRLAMLAGG
jgi:hypothetical protein